MEEQVQEAEVLNTSPVPRKEVRTLTFPEAIIELINGKKITRLEWNDNTIYGFLGEDENIKINMPKKLDNWLITAGDLNGIDWVVVEDRN